MKRLTKKMTSSFESVCELFCQKFDIEMNKNFDIYIAPNGIEWFCCMFYPHCAYRAQTEYDIASHLFQHLHGRELPQSVYERLRNQQLPQQGETSKKITMVNTKKTVLSLKGICASNFTNEISRVANYRGMEGRFYRCNVCTYTSKSSSMVASHVYFIHQGAKIDCIRPGCDKAFRSGMAWREHQKNHECHFGEGRNLVVGNCRNNFLYQYIESRDDSKFACVWPGCGLAYSKKSACKRHVHNAHVCPNRKNEKWRKKFNEFL